MILRSLHYGLVRYVMLRPISRPDGAPHLPWFVARVWLSPRVASRLLSSRVEVHPFGTTEVQIAQNFWIFDELLFESGYFRSIEEALCFDFLVPYTPTGFGIES